MTHMADEGITFEPTVCHYEAKVGTYKVKISGYSVSDTTDDSGNPDRLDLFVSLYKGVDELEPLPDSEAGKAAKEGLQFLRFCATGQLSGKLDETNDAYALVTEVERIFKTLDSIRIFVITDAVAKTRNYAPQEVEGKQVRLEIMDIQRLFNHWQQGRPRDELVVNFRDICGTALPSVWVPGSGDDEYDYALTAVPARPCGSFTKSMARGSSKQTCAPFWELAARESIRESVTACATTLTVSWPITTASSLLPTKPSSTPRQMARQAFSGSRACR